MSVLLDTNILIDLSKRNPAARAWLASLPGKPATSWICIAEHRAGLRTEAEERVHSSFEIVLEVLGINGLIADRAGAYRQAFMRSHNLDIADCLIAATAVEVGLPLATLNLKHFPMLAPEQLLRPY